MNPSDPVLLERLALGGDAVARLPSVDPSRPGQVVFVPFGAPGDRVIFSSLRKENSFARGWIGEITDPSPQRREPRCPLFFKPGRAPQQVCGGCDWQHLHSASQAEGKRTLLLETLQRVGKIAQPNVQETVSASSPDGAWRYRNKGLVPFARNAEGKIVAGFYAPGSHTVVPLENCPVQNERFDLAVRAAREWFAERDVSLYDPTTETGWLRHLLVRTASTGETLVAPVTTSSDGLDMAAFAHDLRKTCPFVTSVFHNINDRPGNVVLGPRWKLLAGKTHLEEKLLGLRFRLSPGAFFQVNHAMAEKLYTLAVDMAAVGALDVVWELYAGVGAMGQLLARKAKLVWAVEENAQAVRDGIESLELNKVPNVRFRQGQCELVLARALVKDKPAVVLLDPPRAGCDKSVLKFVMRAGPQRIVYVSCDPGTLARDAQYLSTGGYHLKRSVPVDLFPQTAHIESVSLFERAAGR
ncbi:MAG: 23S rRNA (uracil(1939)-C(5))-methyltransferase RlmD [Elusimicrobia bacterium]|nr:23S rRNA (uracil(1939)-C(5))-methyltransferase RlmD [Elusimicrobiota bacterium]